MQDPAFTDAHVWVLDTGRDRCATRIAGAKLGAIVRRRQATLSPFKRSIYVLDLTSCHGERHRATRSISFASRGSGVQIPSATLSHPQLHVNPQVSALTCDHVGLPGFVLSDSGSDGVRFWEPILNQQIGADIRERFIT